jgi:thiamine biosynthesis protein ThiI|tara:strand:- start:11183 stop:12418 length:1236 start_codon:yes stop_codon:yes gene_type:complete
VPSDIPNPEELSKASHLGTGLIVRYHEIALKGGNRAMFEKRLDQNLQSALSSFSRVSVRRIRGRMLVQSDTPASRMASAAAKVFGVSSISAAVETEPDLDAIGESARAQVGKILERHYQGRDLVRFRVTSNRADKRFPLSSTEMNGQIGGRILPEFPCLKVSLNDPEVEVEVDLRPEGTWVFSERFRGPGGLPVSSTGRALSLLSGGIDSPVASWLSMKRGMRVDFVSFYSFPHVGPQTRDKIIRQVENLMKWQPRAMLHIVPFAPIQEAIRDFCPATYRTVLYRRAMQRIASKIAKRTKCKVLITGESVGQVASQTLNNLSVIEEASYVPVLRPLITFDKQETIDLAQKIGTFETSNLPAPDCCTVFQPEHPVIYGQIEEAHAAEGPLDLDSLCATAVRETERLHFPERS